MMRAIVVTLLLSSPTLADGQRFAVVIGNNAGAPGEARLRYAEDDAEKMADTLIRVGGFAASNITVLRGPSREQVRAALLSTNDRVRTSPGALLLVYYSGHADARALHLDDEELPFKELEQYVHGSSAAFRILVIDACRSGAITKVKGGAPAAPFSIELDAATSSTSEGYVVLTAAAAGEDAQESDAISGSFFTHHLTSALLGAADVDDDQVVTLEETYRYTFAHTVRDSSATLAGIQHPTFRYDLRGKGDVALARLADSRGGRLVFPSGIGFVVFSERGADRGRVIAEVTRDAPGRQLVVAPGEYFVRGRGRDVLYEGSVDVDGGKTFHVRLDDLESVAYARLVRKGSAAIVHGPRISYSGHSPWQETTSICQGVRAAWPVVLSYASVVPRAHLCSGSFPASGGIVASETEAALDAQLTHVFDFPLASVEVAAFVGWTWVQQRFETPTRTAPARTSHAPTGGIGLGVVVDLPIPPGAYLYGNVEGRTALLPLDDGVTAKVGSPAVVGWDVGIGVQLH